jgi:hypothetical protein
MRWRVPPHRLFRLEPPATPLAVALPRFDRQLQAGTPLASSAVAVTAGAASAGRAPGGTRSITPKPDGPPLAPTR